MKDFIKALFKDIIENENYDETLIDKYFSRNYVQIVDGQTLDFETFKKHIQKLKEKVQDTEVMFANIAGNETSVFTKHYVKSTLKNGEIMKHKVFAEFQIEDSKVIRCDAMAMLVKGAESESGLGSAV